MKNLLSFFILFSVMTNAQYNVKGIMSPADKHTKALLYKIEGARLLYIKKSQITKDTTSGIFSFEMDADTHVGSYRITYDLEKNRHLDFLYNKEDIEFTFDPNDLSGTLNFTKSTENKIYQSFINDNSLAQDKIDSLQIDYLQNPKEKTSFAYKQAVKEVNLVQSTYTQKTNNMLAHDFITATNRYNSLEVAKSSKEYVLGVLGHYYDNIDFTNQNLFNSSFLIDKVNDYVFYMSYAENSENQLELYKNAVDVTLSNIDDLSFKSDIIQYLTSRFARLKDVDMVKYLMTNHYDELLVEYKDAEFEKQIKGQVATMVGSMAPDFEWEEEGSTKRLSTLDDGENYVLIFYSTNCPHCLKEVPQVYKTLRTKTKTKVVAFAIEEESENWKNFIKQYPEWHHALGLGKWKNKIARTYNVYATPTFFVLDKSKKIIATPDSLEDLKVFMNQLD